MQLEIKQTNKPKVVFLDWNKTLSNSLFWEQLSDKKHPFHHLESQIINWLFVKNNYLIKSWMRGKITSEEICNKISQDLGVDFQTIFSELVESCLNMQYCDPLIPELIKQIRSKDIKAVIATDNMDTFKRFTVSAMKLQDHYDDILISSELGFVKDDYENGTALFFDKFMSEKGLKYQDCLLLDDSVNSMTILKKIGIQAIHIYDSAQLVKELKNLIA
jgi:FMN phosphatase YigB (HAD superfamily)